MLAKPRPRTGGRSARIQTAIHKAVGELLEEMERSVINVPVIAARAGVLASTIYRRWGDLTQLLADVAFKSLRRRNLPPDTGDLKGDLQVWTDEFTNQISSDVGRAMLFDIVSASGGAGSSPSPCAAYVKEQISIISNRSVSRGGPEFDLALSIDYVLAPVIYRILFRLDFNAATSRMLIDRMLGELSGVAIRAV